MNRQRRKRKLLFNWWFNCSCSSCLASPELSSASDERLVRIAALAKNLEQNWQTSPPEAAEALVSLYLQERLYAPLSAAYRLVALTCCAHGQYWRTIKYANLAVEFGMLDYGFGDEDVQVMAQLAKEPEGEDCWLAGVRKRRVG
jgi:hypothetical protein